MVLWMRPPQHSFGPEGGPQCVSDNCFKWSTYVLDGIGPVCPVCLAADYNRYIAAGLAPSLGQHHIGLPENVLWNVVSMLEGDGYETLCYCSECRRSWIDRGWVCPWAWARGESVELILPDGFWTDP